jgi:hypothetical protein
MGRLFLFFEGGEDPLKVRRDAFVHLDHAEVPVGAGPGDELLGGDQLLAVLTEELGGGDKDRAVQAVVGRGNWLTSAA